jgi:hypothetical protein
VDMLMVRVKAKLALKLDLEALNILNQVCV